MVLTYDPTSLSSTSTSTPASTYSLPFSPSSSQSPAPASTSSEGRNEVRSEVRADESSQLGHDEEEESKCTLEFDTLEALAGVATGEGWEERVGGGVITTCTARIDHVLRSNALWL